MHDIELLRDNKKRISMAYQNMSYSMQHQQQADRIIHDK
jgi:hypothetical protein